MCRLFPNYLGRRIPTLKAHKHILTDMNPSHLGGHIPHTYSVVNMYSLYNKSLDTQIYIRLLGLYCKCPYCTW